ncbi:MAG: Asp-tRNA(Asn)/Glu-tRNA(Gln) amidotransferase subunit GatB [Phycisphaerales bacterium]|nr:Asp-tRNA(Asn)/Glu-tRNA(Gln) amidotransferase subunit GatB [Phycisphaerales bacterium]
MANVVDRRLIVGMEVHVELATQAKMFTPAANVAHPSCYDAEPNTLCDPVSIALPGALPTMNHEALEMAMLVGMALGCRIADRCQWDRKNYFYPDLPKGYQISQYEHPICGPGCMTFDGIDGPAQVRITRAHLEEDTGKSGHELPGGRTIEGSIVDFNRAGSPLLEIVTEPDIKSAADAVAFGRELRAICRTLGVTEGIMQKGHMRFEPNINLELTLEDGSSVRTPVVEIKNLNSFRALEQSIEHEIERQEAQWLEDGVEMGPGVKSTRGWDERAGRTLLQRAKEDAHDYRYFPEPDLVPLVIDQDWKDRIGGRLVELPMARRGRWRETFQISAKDANALAQEPRTSDFFEACVAAMVKGGMDEVSAGQAAAKLLLNAGAREARDRGSAIERVGITVEQVAQLSIMRHAGDVGSTAADELFTALCDSDEPAADAAQRLGLLQVSDAGALDAWIDEAVAAHPQAAEDFAAGKDAAMGRIMGHVMKASGGSADASKVRTRLIERLR